MPVRMPSPQDLRDAGRRFGFDVNDEEVDGFSQYIREMLPAYQRLDELVAPTVPVKYPRRDFGARPATEDNRDNGWAWRCSIPGAPNGRLAGKTVGLKDHVRVAGIPLLNSSSVMEGYVPTEDATIVTRLLDAGAEIIGKVVNGSHCFDAIGLSIYPGPQPINPATGRHCAGGSSNGSAVVVANGSADITMGGDQGGSIRIQDGCGPRVWKYPAQTRRPRNGKRSCISIEPPLCIPTKMRYKANMTHNPNNRRYLPLCVIKVSYKKLSACFYSLSLA